jgi:3-hydroxybutyrate dehydrogenase
MPFTNQTMRLEGKSAVVTGSATGIGKAIAEGFAREGARVAIADLNLPGAESVAHEIRSRKATAIPVQMDVSNEKSVESAFATVAKEFGSVDILLSNAGIQIIHPIVEFPFADWQKIIAVHLHGAFLTTRAAMRSMIAGGRGGCILYMGSIHSHIASPNKSAYVAAKHALSGLTKSVAKEGAEHKVRANLISPSFVRTALVEKQIPEQAQQLGITEEEVIKKVMLGATVDGEFTSLEDLAETAIFLAAFPSLALTGQSIVVSHGYFMH